MKLFISAIALILIFTNSAFSQNSTITIQGVTIDSQNNALPFCSIALLEASDSNVYQFTTSDVEGNFQFKKVNKEEYLLNVSFLGYELYEKLMSTTQNGSLIDLGSIVLIQKTTELSEVIVEEERIPISINGDTLEYDAQAFKTRANASVEELLKRLPGIEVDRNGDIKAQGRQVRKVFVNGKEFFGNDPKIATKNLMAEGVNKVQVFYKNTDLATFTGIDDGNGDMAINLKLKRAWMRGYFGNLLGGVGTDSRSRGQFNINRFSDKTQLSFIGMSNNINQGGFSSLRTLQNQALRNGLNEGIVTTKAGGINFNREIGRKTDWRSSYYYSQVGQDIKRSTFQNSISGAELYQSNSNSSLINTDNSHNFNGRLTHEFDSINQLIWTGTARISNNLDTNKSSIDRSGDAISEQNSQSSAVDGLNTSTINSDLLYRHRFRKRGSFVVANANLALIRDQSNFDLNTNTDLLIDTDSDSWQQSQLVQLQDRAIDKTELATLISFMNPIGEQGDKHIETNYEMGIKGRSIDRIFETSFGNTGSSSSVQSQDIFNSNYNYHQPGLKFKLLKKQYLFTTGASLHFSSLSSDIGGSNGQNNRSFQYLIPHLFFRYNLSRDTQLFAEYNSSVSEPAIDIMQPVSYSTDQFNQFTGNSNLEPEHRHEASLRFRTHSQFSFNSFSASVGIARTNANIIRSASIDSLLVRNTSWVNSDRETVSYANTNFSAPLRFIGTKINISVNANWINREVLINQVSDRVNWQNYQLDVSLENWKKNNLDLMAGFRLTRNTSDYQMNHSLNNTFLRKSFYTDMTLYLKRWEIYSSMNYVVFGQAGEQSPDKIPLWTASVSKTFLQNEKARISLAVFDALDVNKNFNQTTQLNYIESVQTNALGRYFMLSFSYKLFKVN